MHCRWGVRWQGGGSGSYCRWDPDPDSCSATVPLTELAAHQQNCEFRPVRCTNRDSSDASVRCLHQCRHREMAQHITGCEFRLVSCAHSGCGAVMSQHLLAAHVGRCSYQQFKCPNAQCNVMVSTVLLEHHRAECPKQKVQCKSEGCEQIMLREQVPMHLAGRQHQALVREHAAKGTASRNVQAGQIDVATALNQILAQSSSPQRSPSPLSPAGCSCTARSTFVGGLNALPPRCSCPASRAPHHKQSLTLHLPDYNRPAEGEGSARFCRDQRVKNNFHKIGSELDTRIAAQEGCLSETGMTTTIDNLQISDRAFREHGAAQEEHRVQHPSRRCAQDAAAREESVTAADQQPNTLPRADECTKAVEEQAAAARLSARQSKVAEAGTAGGNSLAHELQHELCTILEIEQESRLTIEQCERARRQVLLEYEHATCNNTAAAAAATWECQSRSVRPVGSMGQAVFAQQRLSNLQCQPTSCEDSEIPNHNHPADNHQSATARSVEAFGHPQPPWTAGCGSGSVSFQQSLKANAADGPRSAKGLAAYHAAYSPDEQQMHGKRVSFLAFSHASEIERPSHCSANRPSLHCDMSALRPTQSAGHAISGTDTVPPPLQPLDAVNATGESAEKPREICNPVSIGHLQHRFGRWHSSIDSPNSPLVPLNEMLDSPPEEFVNITGKALKGYSPMSLEPSRVDQREAQYTL